MIRLHLLRAGLCSVLLAAAPSPSAWAAPASFAGASQVSATRAVLPDYRLVGPAGAPFSMRALAGKWVWLYLGFASCPDACPTALDELADARKALKDASKVQVAFVSLDPMRDTPERLGAYVGYFDKSFLGITGDRPTLDAFVASLGTRYEIPSDARPDGNYVVGHPNQVFVLDPSGRLAATYAAEREDLGERLAADFNGLPPGAADAPTATAAPPPPTTGVAWCGIGAGSADLTGDALMTRARTLGSGTGVLPLASPMRMWGVRAGDWAWMLHGDAALGYNGQGGSRGSATRAAENWAMFHGSGFVGPGIVDLRAMGSLESLTVPPGGTPQLFQAGETWNYLPLIDRQHPHDAIMELAARYTWNLDPRTAIFAYGGPAGEPALGPPSFMHRPSATDNRWAPLAHHLQDGTHVAYGVATAGLRRDDVQLDASVFNGREPDEDRWDFDFGPLDSWSARASWFPGRNWALQASHGHLEEPELLFPGDVDRTTASATYVVMPTWGTWSSTLAWGQNRENHRQLAVLQSYGLESQADLWFGLHAYGRFELADRIGLLPGDPLARRVGALTFGGVQDLGPRDRYELGLGADATVYSLDPATADAYGGNPLSFRVYLRLRPPAMPELGRQGT